MAEPLRSLVLALLLLPCVALAQDADRFARALRSERALDRWMKKEVHRQRRGQLVTTPSASYVVHHQTFDSLAAFLRREPGVVDAEWDRCIGKQSIWPGHTTFGLRVMIDGKEHERCYRVQEGIPGVIRSPGWRPHVRKDREQLKYLGADDCPGFVEQQRAYCTERRR